VETDRPLKALFERQSQSLLPFIGEHGAGVRVTAVECVELPVPKRTIDSVLRLESEGLVWYRHLEFQAQNDADVPRRCFEYNSRLILHYDRAVFTTVLYLLPGADKNLPDAFRLYVGDRLAYEWRSEAVHMLDAMPKWQSGGAISVLLGFAAERYDMKTFFDVLGKDRVMQSWIWQLGVDEGQVKYARQVCADLVAEFHPAVAADLIPVVEVCDKPETLRSWILQCAKLPDGAFVALVTGKPPVRVARARTTRPSRRSAKRR
jgi:hypothetical protein